MKTKVLKKVIATLCAATMSVAVITPAEALWPKAKSMDVETQYALSDYTTKLAMEGWFLRPSVNKINEIFNEYGIKYYYNSKYENHYSAKYWSDCFAFMCQLSENDIHKIAKFIKSRAKQNLIPNTYGRQSSFVEPRENNILLLNDTLDRIILQIKNAIQEKYAIILDNRRVEELRKTRAIQ